MILLAMLAVFALGVLTGWLWRDGDWIKDRTDEETR